MWNEWTHFKEKTYQNGRHFYGFHSLTVRKKTTLELIKSSYWWFHTVTTRQVRFLKFWSIREQFMDQHGFYYLSRSKCVTVVVLWVPCFAAMFELFPWISWVIVSVGSSCYCLLCSACLCSLYFFLIFVSSTLLPVWLQEAYILIISVYSIVSCFVLKVCFLHVLPHFFPSLIAILCLILVPTRSLLKSTCSVCQVCVCCFRISPYCFF